MFSKQLTPVVLKSNVLSGVKSYVNKGDWDRKTEAIKSFKSDLKDALLKNQDDRCVYCERRLTKLNCPEIEHIAPKSIYPELQFDPMNLAYACHRCNFPPYKGDTDVVESSVGAYPSWKFKFVHPYFDDPSDYFEMIGDAKCYISIKSTATPKQKEKAQCTIDMFDLASTEMTEERMKEVFLNLPTADKARVLSISEYKI